ncbi:MAG: VCBS repeat-containing protein [Bacteroidia bacterium]
MKWKLLLLAALGFLAGCSGNDPGKPAESGPPDGKALMTQYCGGCHSLPSPTDLDQKTWKNQILVRMGAYMGIYNDNQRYYDTVPEKWLEPGVGGQRVMEAGIYPSKPLLTRPEWEALRDYILANAPTATVGAPGMLPIDQNIPTFKARILHPDPTLQPLVTAVSIDESEGTMLAAFFQQNLLSMNPSGKVLKSVEGLYGPVFLDRNETGLSMAEIGSMKGSDHPKGSVVSAPGITGLTGKSGKFRFDSLMRPVMVKWADLDADQDLDAVIAEFGYHLGQLTWRENAGADGFKTHVLDGDDGTLSIHVGDFNGDGIPDILSLHANADERVDLHIGKGKGEFERKRLFRFNPTYGCTAMEVTDWNGDGKLDFLVANGDNGDYPPILKPNNGIRLYLNQGGAEFKEAFYLPFNGAYGLRVRDFNLDGNPDIAAVAFYPDYKSRPEEAFIYFVNQGQDRFKAFTFPEVGLGRWMVMDAGDVDRDGDEDILLGAFDVKSDDCSEETYNHWIKEDVPLILLENLVK